MLSSFIFNSPPKRIVCLVPSITELLHYLGLQTQTVGITKFCIHPPLWHKTIPHIGGTKNVNIAKIIALQPDCIICSKEENVLSQIATLAATTPIYITNVTNFASSLKMIIAIGKLTNKATQAHKLVKEIRQQFAVKIKKPLTAIYLIWQNPYLTVGGDTFIHSMMQKAGFVNILKNLKRYPTLSISQIQSLAPEVILLSTEPFPFKTKHAIALQLLLPNSKVILVNGEMFSWYGSKMLAMPAYFLQLQQYIALL